MERLAPAGEDGAYAPGGDDRDVAADRVPQR
jgi:hypothetical protein